MKPVYVLVRIGLTQQYRQVQHLQRKNLHRRGRCLHRPEALRLVQCPGVSGRSGDRPLRNAHFDGLLRKADTHIHFYCIIAMTVIASGGFPLLFIRRSPLSFGRGVRSVRASFHMTPDMTAAVARVRRTPRIMSQIPIFLTVGIIRRVIACSSGRA